MCVCKRLRKTCLTCCALHDRLLFIDGLDKGWKDRVESIWERENRDETPFVMYILHRVVMNDNVQSHDDDEDHVVNDRHLNKHSVNGKRIASKIAIKHF